MWVSSERIVSNKVFGLYKSIHKSPELEEMIFADEVLKLNVFDNQNDKDKVAPVINDSIKHLIKD